MLPQTHFLLAFIIGLLGYNANIISFPIVIVIALASMFIDIDHLLVYHKHIHDWNIQKFWNITMLGKKHWHFRTLIHNWNSFIIISFILLILAQVDFKSAFIIGAIYIPHFLLDHLNISLEWKRKVLKVKEFGFYTPVLYLELLLDIIFVAVIINLL